MATLQRALELAVQHHAGQFDKAGMPYVFHLMRVSMKGETEEERIVGALHDIVEDTPVTLDDLRNEGFSEVVIMCVDNLTHRDGEEYEDSIERAALHPVSTKVKLRDLDDNMDLSRLPVITAKDEKRLVRYAKAKSRLFDCV